MLVVCSCVGACSVYDALPSNSQAGAPAPRVDAGRPDPTPDAGKPDSGPPKPDAGRDAGPDPVDAGGGMDSGPDDAMMPEPADAATEDAALDAGTSDAGDAGPPPGPVRKRLTITASLVDGDLQNFPVLVRLTNDSALMQARADGKSIYFTATNGTSVLDAEIERFDQPSGELTAWVRLPAISSGSDTVFYLYWDDGMDHSGEFSAAGVWDSDFEGVWHLGGFGDSTSHARNGTNTGTTDIAGRIGRARNFSGSNQYVALGQGLFPNEQYYTMTAWVRRDATPCAEYCAVFTNNDPTDPYYFPGISMYLAGNAAQGNPPVGSIGIYEYASLSSQWHFGTAPTAADTWEFIVLRTNRASNGNASASVNSQSWASLYPGNADTLGWANGPNAQAMIGRFYGYNGMYYYDFRGGIDELHVSSTQRSQAWIRAEYENQKSGSTFLSVTDEPE